MRHLVFTPAAQANLIEIAEYIEDKSGSLETAERFTESLVARCEKWASLPSQIGRLRPELIPDVRSAAAGSYVIFFRYVDMEIIGGVFEVVALLERHRDIDAYFRSRRL